MATEANSAIVGMEAFNMKVYISAALQHVNDTESALCDLRYPHQRLVRSLKQGQTIPEGRMAGHSESIRCTNTNIKHAMIAIPDIGARAVHAGLCTLRV